MRDPRGAEVIQPVLESMKAAMGQRKGAGAAPVMTEEGLMAMLDGMPLGSILRLSAAHMTLPEGVDRRGYIQYLLDQVYEDEA
jgi:hypothetical protein